MFCRNDLTQHSHKHRVSARGKLNLTVVNPQIFVDNNRDGEINTEDNPADNVSDKTDISHPYRFWVNDDDDYSIGNGDTTGENVPVAKSDSDDPGVIDGVRDLEDFSRLNIKVGPLQDLLAQGKIKLGMKWINIQPGGSPSLNLYKSTDQENGGEGYLTDLLTAKLQMKEGFVGKKLQASGSTVGYIDKTAFSGAVAADKTWKGLFEGCAPGKGQLSLVISQPDGKVMVESKGAWVELKPISSMMQTSWGGVYQAPPDETPEVLTFVHGWNMSPAGSQNYAETMYKRLWHRGYKGRFAAMRWNTKYSDAFDKVPGIGDAISAYLADFNGSEFIAWSQSGEPLKTFVDQLPSNYRKTLVAHSMGNIVAASAFLKGMNVSSYALLNGALSSSCYDGSLDLKQTQIRPETVYHDLPGTDSLYPYYWIDGASPDDDPDFLAKKLSYRLRLAEITSGAWINFHLSKDNATTYAWESNQNLTKPPSAFIPESDANGNVYGYDRNLPDGMHLYKLLDPQMGSGQRITLQDSFEAMAFCARPWSKAVGAEPKTKGIIGGEVDMSKPPFDFQDEHSAEFNRTNQQTSLFYDQLLQQLKLGPYAQK